MGISCRKNATKMQNTYKNLHETFETVETLSPKNLKNLNCLMQFFYTLHT